MLTLHCPCLLGLEAPLRHELLTLTYAPEHIVTSDAQVSLHFQDWTSCQAAIADLNFSLRCAERVHLELEAAEITDFDALFDFARNLPWEDWIRPDAPILVKGYSRKSRLFGVPSIQRTLKKAIVERLQRVRHIQGQLTEDSRKVACQVVFAFVEDRLSLRLDTSGDGLHKRGYRPLQHMAPIRETLAAGILSLCHWPQFALDGGVLVDLCAGSGTFPIEALMMLLGRAPGLKRHFRFEQSPLGGQAVFDRAREKARLREAAFQKENQILARIQAYHPIFAADIESDCLKLVERNAQLAGLQGMIQTRRAAVQDWTRRGLEHWTGARQHLLIANPPYGERLEDASTAAQVLKAIGRLALDEKGRLAPDYQLAVISQDPQAEKKLRASSSKRRKLYNGRIPCTLYQYFQPRSRESFEKKEKGSAR